MDHTLRGVRHWPLLAALWMTPAGASEPSAPQGKPDISNLAESASSQPQLSSSLDSDDEEAPPEFTLGPVEPLTPGERKWMHRVDAADLTSYFAEGVLAQARQAQDQGRYRAVLKLLEKEPATLPVRYLQARATQGLGAWAPAAEAYAALARDYPVLKDYFHFEAARAHERQRQWTEAIHHYGAVSPGARRYIDARFGMAYLLEKKKQDYAAAVQALSPLVQPDTPRPNAPAQATAWLTMARLARYQADYNGEHRAHLAVWALHPFSPEAGIAIKGLRDLPYVPKWKVARAETLLSQHHNQEAMEQLERMLPKLELPDPLACRAHFAYGTALRKERKHSLAIRVLKPVAEQCQDAALRPRVLYVLGYSESVVDPESAIPTYLQLAHDYPEHAYADDALFYAAGKALERGEKAAAMGYLDQLIARYPDGNFAAEALFQRFWVHRAEGQGDAALEALTRIEALEGRGSTHESVQRARYWRARVLSAQERAVEAHALLERVAAEGAATWYGLLARSRLAHEAPERAQAIVEKLRVPTSPTEVWPLDAGRLAEDPHFAAGVELLRLGHREAAAELLTVDRRGRGEESIRLLFHMLRVTGHERQARPIAWALRREGLAAPTEAETRLIYSAAYPQAFRDLVVRHCRSARVDPDVMQALIREESAFNPNARSSTGALGLSQLMPATASLVARQLNLTLATPAALLEPRHNIRLGSAYLGGLQRRFSGNLAHAVASYNAGPAAVDRWLTRFPTAELDEWVEQIPVEETRLYVKRVLGSAAAYQFLYDSGTLTTLAFGDRGSNNAGSR
ncbi:transglycosylase SLT domain-containing protein [Archangium primigenium]|uniref:lytic transglycosylase domain-containing protein n=1 Tax=[Archangium] primigenium TaxID=2792470 RepID=UPI00195D6B1B|nr:transglycosylase SLT domain-containing protein [Archangium primigenium]MBM7118379.1 transglycosylase SLT domain-containing protein [Archangium primigenium]